MCLPHMWLSRLDGCWQAGQSIETGSIETGSRGSEGAAGNGVAGVGAGEAAVGVRGGGGGGVVERERGSGGGCIDGAPGLFRRRGARVQKPREGGETGLALMGKLETCRK